MAVTIIDPYDAQMPFPIDLRFRRNSVEERDAIPSNIRWEGMPVYVMNDEAWFYLKGGVLNENWEPLGDGGTGGALQNVYFNSTQPTTQGNDGDIWFRPNDDTIELWFKVTGIWTMLGSWDDDSLTLGETSETAYRGDRGKIAYDHSQEDGNPHNTQIGDIEDLEDELSKALPKTGGEVSGRVIGSEYFYGKGPNDFAQILDIERNDLFLNILDFGADNTGVADSSTAIQDAIDYAFDNTIRRIYVPKGEYLLRSTIFIKSGIIIFGDGMHQSLFKIDSLTSLSNINVLTGWSNRDNNYKALVSTNTNGWGDATFDIEIRDLGVSKTFYNFEVTSDFVFSPILIINSQNTSIENVFVDDADTEGELIGNFRYGFSASVVMSKYINIRGSEFRNSGYESLSVRYLSEHIIVDDCIFRVDKDVSRVATAHCMQVARPTTAVPTLNSQFGRTKCDNIIIQNCSFYLVNNVEHAFTSHASDNIKFISNTVYATRTKSAYWVLKPFDDTNNVIIRDNVIYKKDEVRDFNVDRVEGGVIGIGSTAQRPSPDNFNYVVEGNIINIENYTGADDDYLLYSSIIGNVRTAYSGVSICNNKIRVSGFSDMHIHAIGVRGQENIIQGNSITFIDPASTNNTVAILVNDSANNNISNNVVNGCNIGIKGLDDADISSLYLSSNILQCDTELDFEVTHIVKVAVFDDL